MSSRSPLQDAGNEGSPISIGYFRRHLELRVIYFLGITATMASSIWHTWLNLTGAIILAIPLLYVALSTALVKKRSYRLPDIRTLQTFITVDAVLVGVFVVVMQFALVPSAVFFIAVQLQALLTGNRKDWALINIMMILSISIIYNIYPETYLLAANHLTDVIALAGLFIFSCLYAINLNNELDKLLVKNRQVGAEKKLYKYRTYKLAQYLTPTVWNSINEGKENSLRAERKRITVFFSDIQEFSKLSEQMESETLTALLNSYLTEMAKIATKHGGTIDKFIGDAVMVLFGDTKSDGVKKDCLRCLSMAIEMRRKMKEFQNHWYNKGVKTPLTIRMGINTGFCTVGSFGTSDYTDYTALGAHVNLASRLETSADPGEILISHESWALVKDVIMCRDRGEINVKGFSHPVRAYQVIDFRKNLGKAQTYYEENTQGFSMHVDLEKIKNYDKNKIVESLSEAAERIRDHIVK